MERNRFFTIEIVMGVGSEFCKGMWKGVGSNIRQVIKMSILCKKIIDFM